MNSAVDGDQRGRLDAERRGDFFLSASSAFTVAIRIAGLMPAAVVLPPDPPLTPDTACRRSPAGSASAEARTYRPRQSRPASACRCRGPACRSGRRRRRPMRSRSAPRRTAAAAAPRIDCDAHAGLDRAGRRIARRMPLVPAEFLGALSQIAPHIAFGASGGRFLIRNSTGSIFTLSASSSISTSVMKEPCGCRARASGAAGRC